MPIPRMTFSTPDWDKPLTPEQWRAVRWLYEDRSATAKHEEGET